jgi:hypothetical protein
MIRFLYGLLCLICLVVLSAALFGWVRSDRVGGVDTTDAAAASCTFHARGYQIDGRHAHGVAALLATPEQTAAAWNASAPATQPAIPAIPASPRWQVGPAAFDVATDTTGGKVFFAQSPYWLIAAVATLPLIVWLGLPKKRNPQLCRACHGTLRGSLAQCRKCGETFTVAQY